MQCPVGAIVITKLILPLGLGSVIVPFGARSGVILAIVLLKIMVIALVLLLIGLTIDELLADR